MADYVMIDSEGNSRDLAAERYDDALEEALGSLDYQVVEKTNVPDSDY